VGRYCIPQKAKAGDFRVVCTLLGVVEAGAKILNWKGRDLPRE